MSEKPGRVLGLMMRFCVYIAAFSLIFALPNLVKFGDFSRNKANLNTTIVFLIIAVILYTVNNILSKKQ